LLPFSFINPNRNRLFLLYTMLHAEYNNNVYVFYVTTKDAMSYSSSLGYLFKFTNDMSGAVKWGYGQNQVVYDRYTELSIYSTQGGTIAEDVSGGIIDFNPNGYWKYEIYAADWSSGSPCPPNPTEFGTWQCTNVAGAVIDSGNMDVDVYEITPLVADTYTITEYDTCNPPPSTGGFSLEQQILSKHCQGDSGDPARFLYFTRVERYQNFNSFFIDSVATIGSEIRVYNTTLTYVHTITTQPESVVMNIALSSTPYTVELWKDGSLVDTYNNFHPLSSKMYPSNHSLLCSNNEYIDDPTSCPTTFPFSGSIFFAFNGSYNSTGGDVYTEAIEIGKLLVSEQVGEEQVQYTEREAPESTNYIYNE